MSWNLTVRSFSSGKVLDEVSGGQKVPESVSTTSEIGRNTFSAVDAVKIGVGVGIGVLAVTTAPGATILAASVLAPIAVAGPSSDGSQPRSEGRFDPRTSPDIVYYD